jgi:hypothetical protein
MGESEDELACDGPISPSPAAPTATTQEAHAEQQAGAHPTLGARPGVVRAHAAPWGFLLRLDRSVTPQAALECVGALLTLRNVRGNDSAQCC